MYAVLHIADFALHAVLRTGPEASGTAHLRPAALIESTRKKSLVLAATASARAAGIEPGMTAPHALARCPTLQLRTPQPAAEAEARAVLLAIGLNLSPCVEDTAPGVCTIDLKGADPLKVEPAATAAIVQLTQLGLPATAGIAATPLLALYAARSAGGNLSLSAFALSCLLSGESATGGSPMVEEHGAGQRHTCKNPAATMPVVRVTAPGPFLAPLPLAAADPPAELAGILLQWGVRTLGEFTALSRDDIGRRLGPEALALWDRATGGSPRPLHPVVPPQVFSATMEFEDGIEALEPLLFILRRFVERLALELRAGMFAAAELALTLTLADATQHARRFRLPEPTADPEILFRALHTHLESLQTDAAIIGFALHATPTRPLVRQQGLFDTGLCDPHGFAETLARVVALAGSDRVGTPQREDTHCPDSIKLVPPAPVVPPPAPRSVHPPVGLPLRRFRPPLPANLEFTPDDRQPHYVWTEAFRGEIAHVRGPWRSSGNWWQEDRAWSRLEWDIAITGGGLYRLLRIGESWFIEGEYD